MRPIPHEKSTRTPRLRREFAGAPQVGGSAESSRGPLFDARARPDRSLARLSNLLEKIASKAPAPASGSAAGAVLAAAAALVEKAARLSTRHWEGAADALERANGLRMKSFELIEEDSQAYLGFVEAIRAAKGLEGEAHAEAVGSAHALTIDVPLRLTRASAEVAELAAQLAARGNPNLRADAVVAAILAAAAAEAGATLITVNVEDNDDVRLREAQELAGRASELARSIRTPDSRAPHAD